jgi:nijmegen breakage syndrome protein 1
MASQGRSRSEPETPSSPVPQPPKSTAPVKPEPPPSVRRGRRPVTQSRFKGFDDFDASQMAKPEPILEVLEDEEMQDVQRTSETPSHSAPTQQANPRKRATPPSEDEGDALGALLPAAAAMKKRRLNGASSAVGQDKSRSTSDTRLTRKPKKEVDVLEVARLRREAADEKARLDAESLKEAMEGMDVDAIRNAITIEVMQLKIREKPDQANNDQSDRWDERWNGRKNFKKFRRKGEPQHNRGHAVIVPLEQVKKKSFGIGQEHWLESGSKQKKGSQATEQSQTVHVAADEEENDSQFRHKLGKKQRSQRAEPEEVEVVEDSVVPESTGGTIQVTQTQTQRTQTQTSTQKGKKRLGGEMPKATMQPPKKKGRVLRKKDDDSEEGSDDDTKFRFSRRKR